MLLILNKTPLIWRWLQVLEQERHQLRLRLEEVEEEQQQRLLELAADAAALRWVGVMMRRRMIGRISLNIEQVPSMFHFVSLPLNLFFLLRATLERTEGNARLVERQVNFVSIHIFKQKISNLHPCQSI